MGESKKKKKNVKPILMFVAILVISFCVGLLGGKLFQPVLGPIVKEMPLDEFFMYLLALYACLLLFSFAQTVVHEAGHLLFGLLTGYQFSSFRIGSFMWLEKDGKLTLKRFSLAGTGGQCLMDPPEPVDGKIPYVLYNLGGSLANTIVSVIPLAFAVFFWKLTFVHFMVVLWAGIGLFMAVTNGIPMRIQGMDNDGNNAKSLGKNPKAMQAFWLQMKINAEVAKGAMSKDLPEEWFALPAKEDLKNAMIAAIAVFHCMRLMELGQYEKADALMEELLNEETGMALVHRKILINEQVYCEMLFENRAERYEKLMTEEQKKFMKSMKTSPSILRTQYLYEKYVAKDEKKAEASKAAFEKAAIRYPYTHEIASERAMIELVEKKFEENSVEVEVTTEESSETI